MKSFLLLTLLSLFSIHQIYAHSEGGVETPISDANVAENHRFRRNCNKRGATCVLQNEVTEGPYYFDTQFNRYNITEVHAGVPLILNLTVIDTDTCSVVANAAVDIWHCNATGVYSHFQVSGNNGGTNTTFLRGIQVTDSNGVAQMATIFPGYYTGRVTHIHIKVHINGTVTDSSYVGGSTLHTGQLFFNEDIVNSVTALSPYSQTTQKRTALTSDSIYNAAGSISLMDISYIDSNVGLSGGLYGSITLGVSLSSTACASSNPTGTVSGPGRRTTGSSTSSSLTSSADMTTSATSGTSASTTSSDVETTSSDVEEDSNSSINFPKIWVLAFAFLFIFVQI